MKSILCNRGYIINKEYYDKEIIKNIKKELNVIPFSINKNYYNKGFKIYLENSKQLCIPKYYGINKLGNPEINDISEGISINSKFNGELRDYQKKILDIFLKKLKIKKGGILSIPPGKGKTVLGIYLASILKKKTLVIVHKTFLLNQWKKRIKEYMPTAKIGIIQQNKINIDDCDIVIGMLQSISMKDYDIEVFEDFGFVIIDEVHHLGAETFSKALQKINTEYMIGLSATPKREDKLEKVIYWYIGDILYHENPTINQNIRVNICNFDINHKLFCEVINPRTSQAQMSSMTTNLTNINERSDTIIKSIIKIKLEEPLRKILILSDRLDHLDYMKNIIDNNTNITTSKYIGGMKETELDEAEKADIIFSTYQMSSEGLDIPALNTIVLSTSRKNVEQSVGRILRKQSGYIVTPLIIDIIDNIKQYKNQGNCRKRFYKKITNEKNIKYFKNINNKFILDKSKIKDIKEVIFLDD